MTVVMAREAATTLAQQLANGIDPKQEHRKRRQIDKLKGLTYRKALDEFLNGADLELGKGSIPHAGR